MSWIGEHIWDLVTRFRNHVFVEDGKSVKLVDTANDSLSNMIVFDKTRGTGVTMQANDEIGRLNFTVGNAPFANIVPQIVDYTSGTRAASLTSYVKAKGIDESTPVQGLKLTGSTAVTNRVDVELGNSAVPGEITLNGRVVGNNTFGTNANSGQSIIGDVTVSSTDTGNAPVWTIQTNPTDAGAASTVGTIKFRGKNNNPGGTHILHDMANIFTQVTDVTPGSEDSRFVMQTRHAGNPWSAFEISGTINTYASLQHEFLGPVAVKGWGSGLAFEPILQLHNRDTTLSAFQTLGQIDFINDDDDGTTLQIKGVATEDHVSGSNGGSMLEFYVTPDTTSSLAKAVTIGQDKSLTVEGDIIVNGNDIIFEGTGADDHELTLSGGNPGSDITVTLPASTGTLALTSGDITGTALTASSLTSGNKTIDGHLTIGSNNDTTVHVIEREQVTGTNAGPDIKLKAGTASGNSQNGGDLCLYAGKATGNGDGGEIVFYSSDANSPAVDIIQEDNVLGRWHKNGGLRVEGDLTVVGNDIKDDDGTTCITFDSSGNTTIANTLNASLTGNVTGNAATATTLTAGNKSINGTFQSKGLIVDGDSTVTASENGVALHVDALDVTDDSTSASGTAAIFNHVAFEHPRLMATNSSVTTTNASTVYIKGAPAASTNQTITNAYSLYVKDGGSYFGGDVSLSGNILPGITYVKILPSDFVPDDAGRPAMIDDTGSDRWLESHGTAKLFAYVDIPVGFKATECAIYGSATSAITVYEADINSKTVTSKGTGNIGTPIDGGDFTHVNSDATNYILIELAQASGEEVYGGKLTIAKI